MIDPGRKTSVFIRRAGDYAAGLLEPSVAELGGKGYSLARLSATMPVPDWFAVTPAAFAASLSPQDRAAFAAGDVPAHLVAMLTPSAEVRYELRLALESMCGQGETVAVRSSAADEDSAQLSFAGQLDSFLFVTPEKVAERVADVWRSAFSPRVLAYRRQHGAQTAPAAPAVIVQRMIDATVSGVAFSADPVSGRLDAAVVSALYGLGTALVSGECDADTYQVDSNGEIFSRRLTDKRTAHRAAPDSGEGVAVARVPEEVATMPALDDEQIRGVASLARRAQDYFGSPQDIEWAMRSGELYLLQSRPITTLAAAPGGVLNIWDNSNIAESYGGVTTPLTFSFARHAYEGAYRQFCRLMRIKSSTIAAHDETFRHMLGLIQGRVYYNLLNWYRVLALLPGYKLNRRFMEQMMGVKEALPESALDLPQATSLLSRVRDGWNLAIVTAAFAGHFMTLRRRCDAFFSWLHATLGAARPNYQAMRPDELAAAYRTLESRLINRWDAPLINDLFAMIFFGVLRALCSRWCGDESLQNALVSGQGGMISARPAALVETMAREASADPKVVAALTGAQLEEALEAVRGLPRLDALYKEYLEEFGDRTTDELKLESTTLREDPLMLLRSIGALSARLTRLPSQIPSVVETPRAAAERRAAAALRGHPTHRWVFNWVLHNARERIVARENLRFERTRLFGRVRSILAEIGRKFAQAGILSSERDVFYLEVEEVLGYIEGTTTSADLSGLASLRAAEFERYRALPGPPDRFETRGMVNHSAIVAIEPADVAVDLGRPSTEAGDAIRTGLGCCPGIVRGPVRVVLDPRRATLHSGEILVAERTDPGWVMLFPSASGLLVERGSLLSHSAIVAREMRIPCVVSLAGVTKWLADGDLVELDGATGVVTKLATSEEPNAASPAEPEALAQ